MRVALIAPPLLAVPPKKYGGTELFIAQLAEGLKNAGIDVVVYTNGESTVGVEKRWLYQEAAVADQGEVFDNLKDFNHCFVGDIRRCQRLRHYSRQQRAGTDVHALHVTIASSFTPCTTCTKTI